MPRQKIAVTLEPETVREIDRLVKYSGFSNRSRAVEGAIRLATKYERHRKLLRELAKINPDEEIALAEEFAPLLAEIWPEY